MVELRGPAVLRCERVAGQQHRPTGQLREPRGRAQVRLGRAEDVAAAVEPDDGRRRRAAAAAAVAGAAADAVEDVAVAVIASGGTTVSVGRPAVVVSGAHEQAVGVLVDRPPEDAAHPLAVAVATVVVAVATVVVVVVVATVAVVPRHPLLAEDQHLERPPHAVDVVRVDVGPQRLDPLDDLGPSDRPAERPAGHAQMFIDWTEPPSIR